jgi:hypothetical protein
MGQCEIVVKTRVSGLGSTGTVSSVSADTTYVSVRKYLNGENNPPCALIVRDEIPDMQ